MPEVKLMSHGKIFPLKIRLYIYLHYFILFTCLGNVLCSEILIGEMGNTWPGDMRAQESGNLQMLRYDKIA